MSTLTKCLLLGLAAAAQFNLADCISSSFGSEIDQFRIQIDQGHPWRPPFGLERIGSPWMASVECPDVEEAIRDDLWLSFQNSGREIKRNKVEFAQGATHSRRSAIGDEIDEVVLLRITDGASEGTELARQLIHRPDLEADAEARATVVTNPIDLGVIFPPSNELVLGSGQTARVEAAALSRSKQSLPVEVAAWFDDSPASKKVRQIQLEPDKRETVILDGLHAPVGTSRTVLNIALIGESGDTLWHKEIPTMLVQQSPTWPAFGATETVLRYDSPISVRDPATGTFSNLSYENAWRTGLQDIVVSLPNGARFVFWRGSSYIPFWAGSHNTGLCYEWAELVQPRPENVVDCVEPLMDKELRYGQVKIVESTPARVHVRWTYQSTDLLYNVWGDSAVEDYYFYPDGFGTRVVRLKRDPQAEYELSEFIVLTAAETFPLKILPKNMVDALFLDGSKIAFTFPQIPPSSQGTEDPTRSDQPAIYRVRLHQDESLDAIYFTPHETTLPPVVFGAFLDAGEIVTPAYWGSHWPLARGNATSRKIDERVHVTPCHNSLMSWAQKRPQPLKSGLIKTLDALGRSRSMLVERWAWLIGMTDADDARLLDWARSFANPPDLEVEGASIELNAYSMERRAMRLHVEQPNIAITVKPTVRCVNPVFELVDAPKHLARVTLDGKVVAAERYAWDGSTFWMQADLDAPAVLTLEFEDHVDKVDSTSRTGGGS